VEDLEELKARSRAVWGTGDYGPPSRQLEPAAEALVASLGIAGAPHRPAPRLQLLEVLHA
jgi:hypothetical protein